MARKLSLPSDTARFLETRVFIAQQTGIFTIPQISEAWTISPATIYRYSSPAYRQASRDYGNREYTTYRESLKLQQCYRCAESFRTHARCQDCTILMHGPEKLCDSCFDTRERANIYLWES